ncbi:MAG TPA: HD-GYP domain-containing protein [Clostridiaceae bacterium]|nr:HD-GYP domain-containing protein [Clostridiaceae bacterium]
MENVKLEKNLTGTKLANPVFSQKHSPYYSIDMELKKGCAGKSANIESVDLLFDETRIEAQLLVMNALNKYFDWNSATKDNIILTIGKIIDGLLSNRDIFQNLSELKNVDDYTFEHSINVCVLSLVIGICMDYSIDKLEEIGAGAILHDIGKLRISREILKKPSILTDDEFDEIKKHTIYGYQILKDNSNISPVAAYIALSHHERYDGSGYPMGLEGDNINKFARIVAVADVFDALFSDRVYRKKLHPREIIEYFTKTGSHYFDSEVVDKFVEMVIMYPTGTNVVLSTGERGVVVSNNRGFPLSPVVRIKCDGNNNKFKRFYNNYYEINLADNSDVFIDKVCDIG